MAKTTAKQDAELEVQSEDEEAVVSEEVAETSVDAVVSSEKETIAAREEALPAVSDFDEDENQENRGILEALLIASDDPLPVGRVVSILKGVGAKDVRRLVDELNSCYLDGGRAFTITEVAGGFQFAVHREYASWVRQLAREKAAPRLSIAALESLAVIAFRQPVTKTEVEEVRGVSVDGVLRHLLEKGLVRIAGRAEGPGRPLLYGTTRSFLKHFGLKTLSDLPKPREIEDLLKEREEAFGGGPPDDELSAAIGEVETVEAEGDETVTGEDDEAFGEETEDSEGAEDGSEGRSENGFSGEPGNGTSEPLSGSGGRGITESE